MELTYTLAVGLFTLFNRVAVEKTDLFLYNLSGYFLSSKN